MSPANEWRLKDASSTVVVAWRVLYRCQVYLLVCEPSPGFDVEGLKRHCSQETHDVGGPMLRLIGVTQSVRRLNLPKPKAIYYKPRNLVRQGKNATR